MGMFQRATVVERDFKESNATKRKNNIGKIELGLKLQSPRLQCYIQLRPQCFRGRKVLQILELSHAPPKDRSMRGIDWVMSTSSDS